ncbi:Uga4p [Sugiyamaella lignohabitans]|uniref:Uga4p n=1 Tax=Sugiyamaella lignohabitans TaxID=796027 RepID=A0A167FBY4_9ASCO|nr:Uga4p [Sugiyamaella lignohabitans]ANB15092.1 Uga4p [Sugiyamaella lignohabitans]
MHVHHHQPEGPAAHVSEIGEVQVEQIQVNSVLTSKHIHPVITDHIVGADEEALAALGYKQEFKREFGLWSSFSVSFSLLGLLPSIASTLVYGLGYAGTAGMTSGWIGSMVGILAVACSMAELCSSMPTSGGLYYAAAVLAPPGWGPLAAWITGWSNWLCQVTSSPSIDYALASMMLALKSMHDPSYSASNYQIYLLTVAIMIVQSIISSMSTKFLARFNSAGTIFNSIALVIAFIVILAGNERDSPKFNKSSDVWGTIDNQTEWPNGIAMLMSFVAIIWTMSGYDAPFHLAEECSNAAVASPRAIVMTASIGGIFGWILQIAIAYTVTDINAVFEDELGQPFVTYLTQCLSNKLVNFITALTIVSAFFMGQASMIAASRVCYAYSRDGCFPASFIMATVNKYTGTPVNAVWFNTIIGCLLLLLIFAGDVAIGAIFSVGAIASYVAFTIPIAMRIFFARKTFRKGPWHLGNYSFPIGLLSCMFVLVMIPIMCFPWARGADNTPDQMNWTCVVYFGPMLIAISWYFIYARTFFKGPKVNIEHAIYDTADDQVVVNNPTGVYDGVETTPYHSSEKSKEV